MANLTPITSWTATDVQHFARRTGFGITPQSAAQVATRLPGPFIDEWIDGYPTTAMEGILAERGDVVPVAFIAKLTVGEDVPAVVGDHGFLIPGTMRGEIEYRMHKRNGCLECSILPISSKKDLQCFGTYSSLPLSKKSIALY